MRIQEEMTALEEMLRFGTQVQSLQLAFPIHPDRLHTMQNSMHLICVVMSFVGSLKWRSLNPKLCLAPTLCQAISGGPRYFLELCYFRNIALIGQMTLYSVEAAKAYWNASSSGVSI